MAKLNNRFQPSFSLFPLNNNRTGWQPVNIPLVMVVPFARSVTGIPIASANVCELRFFIEDAPGKSPVAGHTNIGVFVPTFERFSITINSQQLAEVRIDPTGQQFFDAEGNEKTFDEVSEGDLMAYTQLRGPLGAFGQSGPGPRDTVPYFADADYYDLSPFVIETIDLPVGKYNFVWQARYFNRVISPDNEFVCIDTNSPKPLARFANYINHPGDIHEAMVYNSPAFYFEGQSKDQDATIAFYRPFADALQDIFDEQELIKGVNFIDSIPVQYIPYLANLLGLDMPYFPSTTDEIRRALLRNGRRLQQLKGSRRAIRELFEIFGFTIDVANLWFSKDGTRFIAPGEQLPSDIEDQEITTEQVCHSEPALNAYNTPGFGQVEVPLLFRPHENITVDAWLVTDGSPVDVALQAAVNATAADVEAFTTDNCGVTLDGFQLSTELQAAIPSGALGHSMILVNQEQGGIAEAQVGLGKPLGIEGVTFNKDRNSLNITFDRFLNFNRNQKLYVFATYERTKIVLPPTLADLRSNRFDINVLIFKDGEQPSSDIFSFLLEFLFRFKAFHSLLRKISFTVELNAVYNVIDFCAGGIRSQDPNTDAGSLQIPPPVIPPEVNLSNAIELCDSDLINASTKPEDVAFRSKLLRLLDEEHRAWKRLDNTHDVPPEQLPLLQSLSRIMIRPKDEEPCAFTQFGQDRIIDSGNKDFDHEVDNRDKLCDLEGNDKDYCYKGRVEQDIVVDRIMTFDEISRCKPCTLGGGIGSYFMTGLKKQNEFSGGDPGTNAADLTSIINYRRSYHDRGYSRIMAFDNPQIHYSDREFVDDLDDHVNNRYFATRKPSLEVQKDNMFMPGHRFISMAHLEFDFLHPDYNFRPWDYIFDFLCAEDIPDGVTIPELNPRIVIGTDGQEYLEFDPVQLIYYGNGLAADIPVMSDHTQSAIPEHLVTHSIWSSSGAGLSFQRTGGEINYVIDQDSNGLRFPVEALGVQKDIICFTDDIEKIYKSADETCPCPEGENVLVAQSVGTEVTFGGTGTGTEPTAMDPTASLGADFIDGYPAEFGPYIVDLTDFDFPRELVEGYGFSFYGFGIYGALGSMEIIGPAIALGIPLLFNGGRIQTLRFKVGSGIRLVESDLQHRHFEPHRLDCGCEKFICEPDDTGAVVTAVTVGTSDGFGEQLFGFGGFGGTGGGPGSVDPENPLEVVRCPLVEFQMRDGSYDFNCDQVVLTPTMILDEQYGATTCLMDGSIPNMISFDFDKIIFTLEGTSLEDHLPQEGSYRFIDSYGMIHIGLFETSGDTIDITTQVRDPRVWAEDPAGEVIGFRVFRDGMIATDRQIIKVADFGFIIVAEGGDQIVERFQTTFGCGDDTYLDPFVYHLDNNIVDSVDLIVTPVGGDFGEDGFGESGFGG